MFATKGWFASAQVEMNGGVRIADDKLLTLLGGEFNFFQTQLNFRYYQPFFEEKLDRLVFRVNSSAGWQQSTDGRLIPFIHRFRAGGINSVRGYNWFSLGPTVRYGGSDDPIHADEPLIAGGTSIWVNNIEIESGLVPQAGIFGVVFFDAGNTFGDATGKGFINPLDMRASYGAGVRWRSPIGPLRFELGIPINPEPGWRTAVFDFGIGNFF
jgi:outer membrane protein insertion porin family